MNTNEGLFRKKSLDKISSPEQLNDYIRVANPGVWTILSCIIVLLIGICVWGVYGRLETTLDVAAVSQDGTTICYVKEENKSDIKADMTVQIDGEDYPVESIAASPSQVTGDFNAYALHVGDLQTGEWVYEVTVDAALSDGIYEATFVTESIAPMSFLLN